MPTSCGHRITAGMVVGLIASGSSRERILALDATPAADQDCCAIICRWELWISGWRDLRSVSLHFTVFDFFVGIS
jgi:hypothetical protein